MCAGHISFFKFEQMSLMLRKEPIHVNKEMPKLTIWVNPNKNQPNHRFVV